MKNQLDSAQTQLQIDIQLHQYIILAERLLIGLIQQFGCQCQSPFNSNEIPSISIQSYLRRIHKYSHYSSESLMIALLYVDRYNNANEHFSLNWHNVHKVILTCLLLAAKFHDDVYYDNATFAVGGGVTKQALFQFEIQVFQTIGFKALVKQEDYDDLIEKLYSVYGEDNESQCKEDDSEVNIKQ